MNGCISIVVLCSLMAVVAVDGWSFSRREASDSERDAPIMGGDTDIEREEAGVDDDILNLADMKPYAESRTNNKVMFSDDENKVDKEVQEKEDKAVYEDAEDDESEDSNDDEEDDEEPDNGDATADDQGESKVANHPGTGKVSTKSKTHVSITNSTSVQEPHITNQTSIVETVDEHGNRRTLKNTSSKTIVTITNTSSTTTTTHKVLISVGGHKVIIKDGDVMKCAFPYLLKGEASSTCRRLVHVS